jgi:Domain of unknown function (DUF4157)/D-alanyl-D-alanine carboxypeptidase
MTQSQNRNDPGRVSRGAGFADLAPAVKVSRSESVVAQGPTSGSGQTGQPGSHSARRIWRLRPSAVPPLPDEARHTSDLTTVPRWAQALAGQYEVTPKVELGADRPDLQGAWAVTNVDRIAIARDAPTGPEGRRLLAHELAHVIQQSAPADRLSTGGPVTGRGAEQEADAAAEAIVSGRPMPLLSRAYGPARQKRPEAADAAQAGTRDQAAADAANVERLSDPDASIADRLAAAGALVGSDWLDAVAWDNYVAGGGTATAVAAQIWAGELGLGDVDAAKLPQPQKRTAADLKRRLAGRITSILARHFAAELKNLQTAGGQQAISDVVDRFWPEKPGWALTEMTDRLFHERIGPGIVGDLTGNANEAARQYWQALNDAAKQLLTARRKHDLAPAAVAALDPEEVAAVMAALEPMSTWIATATDMDGLADTIAGVLGRPVAHTDPAWQQLRERLAVLVPVAEVQIINGLIPQKEGKKSREVWPERWSELRDRWLRTITKPVWRFWQDNIVDTTFFGQPIRRSETDQGVHRDVVPSLRRVEQSAVRLSGKSVSDVNKAVNEARVGSEFRFEPVGQYGWMSESRYLSFHGTGRAIDFRSDTNPHLHPLTHELVNVVAGIDLPELPVERPRLEKWADKLADLDKQADARAATDPEANDLRADVSRAYGQIQLVELLFQLKWAALTQNSPSDKDLLDRLEPMVASAKHDAEEELAKLAVEPPVTVKPDPNIARLKAQATNKLERIKELEKALANIRVGKPANDEQANLLHAAKGAAAKGFTDLPFWLVQAFTEQGWNWGGTWIGQSDLMHFDYMGHVSDVIAQ